MEIALSQIIFQIINFGVIVYVLKKLIYKPVLKVLEQRAQKIDEGMRAAESNIKIQNEADETLKTKKAEAQKEAAKILAETKKKAQKDAEEILRKAKEEAKTLVEKERAGMEASLDQDRANLEAKFTDMLTQSLRELLQGHLTEAQQKTIIQGQIRDLKKLKLA